MDLTISEEIKNATKCRNNFSCLSEEKSDFCEVKSSTGYETLFAALNHPTSCQYCIHYHDSSLCVCPTRNEIYRIYKI